MCSRRDDHVRDHDGGGVNITGYELALCAAALDAAAKDLNESCAAAAKLNLPMPGNIKTTAMEMLALRDKIMSCGADEALK